MTRKMDIAVDALGLKPGDHVLEVGGGWGAFTEYAGQQRHRGHHAHPVQGVGALPQRPDRREDLPATVVRQHIFGYTSPTPVRRDRQHGRHRAPARLRTTLRKYAELVKPGGRVYLDALAMRAKHRVSTFMSRYVYPGGPRRCCCTSYLREVARSPFELISVDDDRHNYYLTCQRWAQRLDAARDEVVRRWGEPLYRRFRLFLWGSAAGFDTGLVQAYRWVLRMPAAKTI